MPVSGQKNYTSIDPKQFFMPLKNEAYQIHLPEKHKKQAKPQPTTPQEPGVSDTLAREVLKKRPNPIQQPLKNQVYQIHLPEKVKKKRPNPNNPSKTRSIRYVCSRSSKRTGQTPTNNPSKVRCISEKFKKQAKVYPTTPQKPDVSDTPAREAQNYTGIDPK